MVTRLPINPYASCPTGAKNGPAYTFKVPKGLRKQRVANPGEQEREIDTGVAIELTPLANYIFHHICVCYSSHKWLRALSVHPNKQEFSWRLSFLREQRLQSRLQKLQGGYLSCVLGYTVTKAVPVQGLHVAFRRLIVHSTKLLYSTVVRAGMSNVTNSRETNTTLMLRNPADWCLGVRANTHGCSLLPWERRLLSLALASNFCFSGLCLLGWSLGLGEKIEESWRRIIC